MPFCDSPKRYPIAEIPLAKKRRICYENVNANHYGGTTMKVTGFSPLIITNSSDADNMIKLFEDLGFEQRHSIFSSTVGISTTSP